jgi:hypothetical protein
MAASARPLLAIGLATAGIGFALAVAAAPEAAAAPTNLRSHSTGGQQLVRKSAKATPTGAFTTRTATSSSSTRGTAPTSHAFVASSGGASGAVKHHWGTHHGHHGLL